MSRNMYLVLLGVVAISAFSGQSFAQAYNSQYIVLVYNGDDRSADQKDWSGLGCKWLDFRGNKYVMDIGRKKGRFNRLLLSFDNKDFKLSVVRVVFGNGESKRIRVADEDYRSGYDVILKVSGGRRYIKRLVMRFRTGRSVGSNVVCINGGQGRSERGRGRGRASVAVMPKERDRWEQLGCFRVRRKTAHKGFSVGRARGRYKALRIYVTRSPAKIKHFSVVFGNGKNKDLGAGKISRNEYFRVPPFRHTRFIESVKIHARGKDIFKKSHICVQGLVPGEKSDYDDR